MEGFAVFLAVPNLLLAAGLGILLALNVTAPIYVYTQVRSCCLAKSVSGIFASAPAFLTGFACCAPTVAIFIGSISAAAFVVLIQVFMPVAFAALMLALAWNLLRRLPS